MILNDLLLEISLCLDFVTMYFEYMQVTKILKVYCKYCTLFYTVKFKIYSSCGYTCDHVFSITGLQSCVLNRAASHRALYFNNLLAPQSLLKDWLLLLRAASPRLQMWESNTITIVLRNSYGINISL